MNLIPKLLPHGLEQQQGPCEKRPDDFMDGFVLPSHFSKPTHKIFPETVHKDMIFEEEDHLYINYIDGLRIPASESVTHFAHAYQEPFDGNMIIPLMRNSKKQKWPRKEYANNVVKVTKENLVSDKGCMLVYNDLTISIIYPNSTFGLSGEQLYDILIETSIQTEELYDTFKEEIYTFESAMTTVEILYKWDRNGLLKRNMGTSAHRSCELALEGLPYRWDDPEMKAFHKFIEEYIIPNGATIMSTEREIRSLRLDIAGSVDAVFKLPDDSLVIVDWKLSDKLYMNMIGFKKMKKPLNHLDDCDGAGYALQTSLYQKLFELEYGHRVSERILVSLSPDNPFITSVPYLEKEAQFILDKQAALIEARNNVEGFKCDITKKTLVNAVKCSDGRIVSEKVAKLHKLEYKEDIETRMRVDEEVSKHMKEVLFDNSGVVNWKKMMPKTGGIKPFS